MYKRKKYAPYCARKLLCRVRKVAASLDVAVGAAAVAVVVSGVVTGFAVVWVVVLVEVVLVLIVLVEVVLVTVLVAVELLIMVVAAAALPLDDFGATLTHADFFFKGLAIVPAARARRMNVMNRVILLMSGE